MANLAADEYPRATPGRRDCRAMISSSSLPATRRRQNTMRAFDSRSHYSRVLLVAAVMIIGGGTARGDDQIHVGKAQGTAWTFLPVDIGIEQDFFGKQGLNVDIASLGGDAKVQQALAAGSIDFGLGSGPGWRLRPRAHQRSACRVRWAAAQHLSDGARRFANQENRRSQGQVDRCFHGGLAQRLVGQANGDPGRLGSGRHTHRTIGCGRDQHRRAQVQAGGCRGAVYRGGFRSRRAQRRPPTRSNGSLRAAFHHPCGVCTKVYRREQTRDSGTFPQGLLCGNCFYESTS